MDNTLKLNCKKPIYILTIITLLFSIVGCLRYFFYYQPIGNINPFNGAVAIEGYELKFFAPDILCRESILTILTLSSIILLVLYIFVFYKKLKGRFVLPVIFGILSVEKILNVSTHKTLFSKFFCCLLLIGYILGLISSIRGFNKKKSIIVATSILLLFETIAFIYDARDWASYDSLYYDNLYICYIVNVSAFVGKISLYVTILLFALKNKIPSVKNVINKNKVITKTNPEQELKLLKDKLKFGMITEEEYNSKRAEIISKL